MIDTPVLSLKEIVYFVNDIKRARDWYLLAFGGSKDFESEFYNSITAGGVSIGFHPSDEKPCLGLKDRLPIG